MPASAAGFTTGVAAACIAEVSTFPLDLIKTRLQIQGSAQVESVARQDIRGIVREVYAAEGINGFYRGIVPSCMRHFIYSGGRMLIYETLREDIIGRDADGGFSLWKGVLAGMCTGAIAQFGASPCDLVKVRMQIDGKRVIEGHTPRYNGTLHAYQQIWKQQGLRGMWAGWLPTCQRAALVQLGDLTAYDMAKQTLVPQLGDNVMCHIGCSLFAGGVAAFMSCPADVMKTRLMNQDPHNPVYTGMIDCFKKSVKKEGVLSLWKANP